MSTSDRPPAGEYVLNEEDIAYARQVAAGAPPFTTVQQEELRVLLAITADSVVIHGRRAGQRDRGRLSESTRPRGWCKGQRGASAARVTAAGPLGVTEADLVASDDDMSAA